MKAAGAWGLIMGFTEAEHRSKELRPFDLARVGLSSDAASARADASQIRY
jgi:hypothetical protein